MLYLDYGKKDGEWVANKYGGNKNLEAIDFFKASEHCSAGKKPWNCYDRRGIYCMAEGYRRSGGRADWASACKWNMGWMNDFTGIHEAGSLFP